MQKKKIILLILAILTGLVSGYCLLGTIMTAWLSATPDYPLDAAKISMIKWSISAVFFIVLTILLVVLAVRKR